MSSASGFGPALIDVAKAAGGVPTGQSQGGQLPKRRPCRDIERPGERGKLLCLADLHSTVRREPAARAARGAGTTSGQAWDDLALAAQINYLARFTVYSFQLRENHVVSSFQNIIQLAMARNINVRFHSSSIEKATHNRIYIYIYGFASFRHVCI